MIVTEKIYNKLDVTFLEDIMAFVSIPKLFYKTTVSTFQKRANVFLVYFLFMNYLVCLIIRFIIYVRYRVIMF